MVQNVAAGRPLYHYYQIGSCLLFPLCYCFFFLIYFLFSKHSFVYFILLDWNFKPKKGEKIPVASFRFLLLTLHLWKCKHAFEMLWVYVSVSRVTDKAGDLMEHRLPLLTTCPAYLAAFLAACWSVYNFEQAPKKFTCVCVCVCT